MGRTGTDSIWSEWRDCGVIDGKRYATCRLCNLKLQVNVTRFKHHIVQKCPYAPDELINKYKELVCRV